MCKTPNWRNLSLLGNVSENGSQKSSGALVSHGKSYRTFPRCSAGSRRSVFNYFIFKVTLKHLKHHPQISPSQSQARFLVRGGRLEPAAAAETLGLSETGPRLLWRWSPDAVWPTTAGGWESGQRRSSSQRQFFLGVK